MVCFLGPPHPPTHTHTHTHTPTHPALTPLHPLFPRPQQVVVVSSTAERVNATVKSIGAAAQGEVVDATKEAEVSHCQAVHGCMSMCMTKCMYMRA
jgi:hypothetical protein